MRFLRRLSGMFNKQAQVSDANAVRGREPHSSSYGLRKQLPSANPTTSAGWLGGCPNVPVGFDWPTHDGQPMVFFGQLDCEEFPEDLWGGLGPRHGWLLFFLPVDFRGDWQKFPCSVLHLPNAGKQTSVQLSHDYSLWYSSVDRKFMPIEATPFPKWHLEIIDLAKLGRELRWPSPYRSEEDVPIWTNFEDLYPVTWELFDELLDILESRAKAQNDELEGYIANLNRSLKEVSSLSQEALTYWDERKRHAYEEALNELKVGSTQLPQQSSNLLSVVNSLRATERSGAMSGPEWDETTRKLGAVMMTTVRWETVYRPERDIARLTFSYVPLFKSKSKDFAELVKHLKLVQSNALQIGKGLPELLSRTMKSLSELPEASKLDPQTAIEVAADRKLLESNLREIEAAERETPEIVEKTGRLLKRIRETEAQGGVLDEDAWVAIRPELETVFLMNYGNRSTPALLEIPRLETRPALDPSFHQVGEWSRTAKFALIQKFCADPDQIPDGPLKFIREYSEWRISEEIDGIGGVEGYPANWDAVDPSLFDDPSSDRDMLLLQLYSSDLNYWMFGDVGHAVFHIKRSALASGDFSSVKVVFSG